MTNPPLFVGRTFKNYRVGETVMYYRSRPFGTRPQVEAVVIKKISPTKANVQAVSDGWPFIVNDVSKLRRMDELDRVGVGETVMCGEDVARVLAIHGAEAWLEGVGIKPLEELVRLWASDGGAAGD